MPEPTGTAGTVFAVTSLSVAGTAFGIPYEPLVLGLGAGLLALKKSENMGNTGAVIKVTVSALFAGAGAPVATEAARVAFGLASPAVQPLCALVIGFGWKPIALAAWTFVRNKWGAQNV